MQDPSPSSRELGQVLRLVRVLLIVIVVVLGWIVLSYLTGVLAPILAALGIAYLLNPVLDRLVRLGASRSLGAGLLLVAFLGVVIAIVVIASPKIAAQVTQFVHDLPRMVDEINRWLREHFGVELPQDWRRYLSSAEVRDMVGNSAEPLQRIAEAALGGVTGVLSGLAEALLVPVFAFYFLVDWPNLLRRLEHMIPPRRRAVVRDIVGEIDGVIANWVRGQAIVTSTLAALYAIAFTIIGMPLSVPIGLVVGALTIIPFVGTLVGAGIAGLVIVADGASTSLLGAAAVVFVVLHLLEAAVLTPKIVGHRVGLSESGALLAVVAGGKLLGFVGVVLAVPIAATFAVFARHAIRYYESTEFFGRESDADVVVTPGMALIMPGAAWTPAVWEHDHATAEPPFELELSEAGRPTPPPEAAPPPPPEPEPEPELELDVPAPAPAPDPDPEA